MARYRERQRTGEPAPERPPAAGRSPEAIARRKAATAAWRASPAGRAYHAAWRAKHKEQERARTDRWRAAHPELVAAQKARYAAAHPRQELPPIPARHVGHELFDRAAELVPRIRTAFVELVSREEEMFDDCRSEAVLAMLEGRDPLTAVRAYRARESNWIRRTGYLGGRITGEMEERAA